MVLLSDFMEYKDWQRVAHAVKNKWHDTHTLDTSDSTIWKLYRKSQFVHDATVCDKPEISFDKDKVVVYLCADHITLENSVEKFFGKVLKISSPMFRYFEDRREFYFKLNSLLPN